MNHDQARFVDRRLNTQFDQDITELHRRDFCPYRIWRLIQDHGGRIALTTVCRKVRKLKARAT